MTSLDREMIFELTYFYVFLVSKQKRYNAQTLANNNLFLSKSKTELFDIMGLSAKEFCATFECEKVKDFIYKSDSFTPRNMYLINPLYYLYYTYIVFRLTNTLYAGQVDFSTGNIVAYYSGLLDFNATQENIKHYASFNHSYSLFQKKRKEYFGKPVTRLDIHNFFDNIKTDELIIKLKGKFGDQEIIEELECFLKKSGFESLPQFHYSIASSILSQLYLSEFDASIQDLLTSNSIVMVRFVDDMYLIHTGGYITHKDYNKLVDEVSSLLWKQCLALNTSKTKLLSADEFSREFEVMASDYDDNGFSSEKIIEEKAIEVIESGNLIEFINRLCQLEMDRGIDITRYQSLLSVYLSVNGDDANKVLKNIVFSSKWVKLDIGDMKKIINRSKFILFSPSEFTVLYLKIYNLLYRNKVISDINKKRKVVLNYFLNSDVPFSYRKCHVATTCIIQNEPVGRELIQKIDGMNPGYVRFLELYVII